MITENLIDGLSLEQLQFILKVIVTQEPINQRKVYNLIKYSEKRGSINNAPAGDKGQNIADIQYNGDCIEGSYGSNKII